MARKDHYETLQVSRCASLEVIRAAYRSLSQRWHPDRNAGSEGASELMMKDLNAAYQVLSNPESRMAYDASLGLEALPEGAAEPPFSQAAPGSVGDTTAARAVSPRHQQPERASRTDRGDDSFLNIAGVTVFALCALGFLTALWELSWFYVVLLSVGIALAVVAGRAPLAWLRGGPSDSSTARRRPWVRFLARVLDIQISSVALLLAMDGLGLGQTSDHLARTAVILISPMVWIVIESALLVHYGTTPGKWLLNVKISHMSGTVTARAALIRSLTVWSKGLGFGIPGIWIATSLVAYRRLVVTGAAAWDRSAGFHLSHGRVGAARAVGFAAALGLCLLAQKSLLGG